MPNKNTYRKFFTKPTLLMPIVLLLLLVTGCASVPVHSPTDNGLAYVVESDDSLLSRYMPTFVIENPEEDYNHIGTARAELTTKQKERIYIEPTKATVYTETRKFQTDNSNYTNLFYRIHFEQTPSGLGKGKNTGLFFILTLNSRNQLILVTSLHTCGCYMAFVPTSTMPASALSKGWSKDRQNVYGQSLPRLLDYNTMKPEPHKLMFLIGAKEHRVKDIWFEPTRNLEKYKTATAKMQSLASLETLPLEENKTSGEIDKNTQPKVPTTSFYEIDGGRKDYVKGSRKIREKLLMGWWALDLRVGEDKKLGIDSTDGRTFYTSLKPWARKESDLRNFPQFLKYWGWEL